MPSIGLTLADDRVARWLETHPGAVDCLDLSAQGFFERPTPYLSWLAGQWPVFLRTPLLSDAPSRLPAGVLDPLAGPATPHSFVVPLAFIRISETQLRRPVPPPRTRGSLSQVTRALAKSGLPAARTLVEPTTALLRQPGTMDEPAFLAAICEEAGCRLLVDISTLVAGSRNHQFDPVWWLSGLPAGRIAAVRIGGLARDGAWWQHDPAGPIDSETWDTLARVVRDACPEVLLLGPRATDQGVDGLKQELARLRQVGTSQRSAPSIAESAGRIPGTRSDQPAVRDPEPLGPLQLDSPAAPRVTPDVALFVLDHEGVLVSEVRRELTQLNTAATFAWCLLEDGQDPSAIARDYSDTFGVPHHEAERHVGTVLRHWFGRGFVSAPSALPSDSTPFMSVLAWLLTNGTLRARFRQDPARVADALSVTAEDKELLLSLDSRELEAQAAFEKPAPAAAPAPSLGTADTHIADHVERAEEERRYQVLSTVFAIRSDDGTILRALDSALGHFQIETARGSHATPGGIAAPVTVRIHGTQILLDDDALDAGAAAAVVPAVKQLVRERAVQRHPFLLTVHAGVVAFGDSCVLMPAQAGSGKTTLTAALVTAGATYFSDEVAVLAGQDMAVTPVPLSLTIKDGSLEPLRALYPEIDLLARHIREDYVPVRYLPPPPGSLPAPGTTARARWIVFPTYTAGAETALNPIDRPAALRRLLDESYFPPAKMTKQNVEYLVRWMRTVDCYELPFSSLDEAVQLISGLVTVRRD